MNEADQKLHKNLRLVFNDIGRLYALSAGELEQIARCNEETLRLYFGDDYVLIDSLAEKLMAKEEVMQMALKIVQRERQSPPRENAKAHNKGA